jgi:hypothetical protein
MQEMKLQAVRPMRQLIANALSSSKREQEARAHNAHCGF